jgi:hypothetical protein
MYNFEITILIQYSPKSRETSQGRAGIMCTYMCGISGIVAVYPSGATPNETEVSTLACKIS